MQSFNKRMTAAAVGVAAALLATPVRLCQFHRAVFPSAFLLPMVPAQHPVDKTVWWTLDVTHTKPGRTMYVRADQKALQQLIERDWFHKFAVPSGSVREDFVAHVRKQLIAHAVHVLISAARDKPAHFHLVDLAAPNTPPLSSTSPTTVPDTPPGPKMQLLFTAVPPLQQPPFVDYIEPYVRTSLRCDSSLPAPYDTVTRIDHRGVSLAQAAQQLFPSTPLSPNHAIVFGSGLQKSAIRLAQTMLRLKGFDTL